MRVQDLQQFLNKFTAGSDAIKNDGFAVLIAECKFGIGSDGIQSVIDGRTDIDNLKKPSQYLLHFLLISFR